MTVSMRVGWTLEEENRLLKKLLAGGDAGQCRR
jgi:hypothetical protein